MSSIQLPKDLEILRFLQLEQRTRYEVKKKIGNHYQSTINRLDRLEKIGLVFVSETKPWRKVKVQKFYLITAKGRAILRGHEEGDRRT